jgi:hypothetical protein
MKEKINQKGFIKIPSLIALIIGILVISGGSYFGYTRFKNYQAEQSEKEKQARELIVSQQKVLEETKTDLQNNQKLIINQQQALNEAKKALEESQLIVKYIIVDTPLLHDDLQPTLSTLNRGDKITIIKQSGDYSYVHAPCGNLENCLIGWVNNKYLADSPNQILDLTSIIADWRPKTAYIVCSWKNSAGQVFQAVSGSGFLAAFSLGNQIITNKHIVVDPQYGVATVCIFKFPDDGSGWYPVSNNSSIKIDSAGYDVGYITSLEPSRGNTSKTIGDRAGESFDFCKQAPNIGDPVVVIGYPDYGTGTLIQNLASVEVTATEGIISGFANGYYTTSAKIEHGNSGGLAIDETHDCYLGIPSAAAVGGIESLGRILPASLFLR